MRRAARSAVEPAVRATNSHPVVFLSYRSTNSRLARLIAAWLTINGVRVWIAEEQIGLELQFDRPAIRESLRRAIEACSHCVILTNSSYLASDWCRFEAELIGERRRRGALPIIEIRAPSEAAVHANFEFLAASDVGSITLQAGAEPVFRGLEQEMRRRGWPLPSSMHGLAQSPGHGLRTRLETPSGIEVPMGDWRPADERPDLLAEGADGTLRSQHFRRSEPFPAEASVSFVRYERQADSDRPTAATASDWDVREWAVRTLPKVFADSTSVSRIDAVHLDRLWGRVHLGVSYSLQEPHPRWGRVAVRKHWSYVYASSTESDIAMVATFFVYGGRRRLLTLTPLFEHYLRQLELAMRPIVWTGVANGSPVDRADGEVAESLQSMSQLGVPDEPRCFDLVPPAESLGFEYRLRQVKRWLTGRW